MIAKVSNKKKDIIIITIPTLCKCNSMFYKKIQSPIVKSRRKNVFEKGEFGIKKKKM